jgi:hypothetical protein
MGSRAAFRQLMMRRTRPSRQQHSRPKSKGRPPRRALTVNWESCDRSFNYHHNGASWEARAGSATAAGRSAVTRGFDREGSTGRIYLDPFRKPRAIFEFRAPIIAIVMLKLEGSLGLICPLVLWIVQSPHGQPVRSPRLRARHARNFTAS